MKAYTNLEQSKKLAEILPLESADMCYIKDKPNIGFLQEEYKEFGDTILQDYYPCWSLAALLGVIPKPDLIQNSEGTWLVHSWVNAYPWSVGGYSNPIDACVAMIEKLHKINLI